MKCNVVCICYHCGDYKIAFVSINVKIINMTHTQHTCTVHEYRIYCKPYFVFLRTELTAECLIFSPMANFPWKPHLGFAL